jgi:hypothetical protein
VTDQQSSMPPGWYPDPERQGHQREWDGQQWAGPSIPSVGGAAPAPAPARKGTPTWLLPVVACLALAVGAVIGGAVAGSGDDDGDDVVAEATSTTAAAEDDAEPSNTVADEEDPEATETTTTTAPTTTTTTAPAEPIVQSGVGVQLTAPFEVPAGDYAVHYAFSDDCYYSSNLVPVGGETYDGFDLGSGTGPVEGDTYAYGVEAGEYYIDLNTGPAPSCPWEFTLTPQG